MVSIPSPVQSAFPLEASLLTKPILTPRSAAAKVVPSGSIMVGGFLGCGAPHTLIQALKAAGTRDLTLISCDTGVHDLRTGRIGSVAHLVANRQFSRIYASHIGLNQEAQRQMNAGETAVELVPMGSLAERIRAGGAGLGGILTPTGVGTEVAAGKQLVQVAGESFLLETPFKADVAFIKARRADRCGNLVYRGTARNFNPLMATAARLVVAEVEEIVEPGELNPDLVHTPSIFVDFLVLAERLEAWEEP